MNAIMPFTFETHAVRAIERGGDPWFVAADVCAALGLTNPRDAVAKLDEDEKGVAISDTLGGAQRVTVLSEAGVYTLTLRCRDAMVPGAPAYRFRKWVTGELLPAVRRRGHGGVATDAMQALADPATLRTMLLGYSERVLALEATTEAQAGQIAALEPQAAALERIATAETGSMSITAAAKTLQVGPRDLHDWLRANGWTYRHAGGLLAYQSKIDAGLLEHKVGTAEHTTGNRHAYRQVLVTPKGLTKLAHYFNKRSAA